MQLDVFICIFTFIVRRVFPWAYQSSNVHKYILSNRPEIMMILIIHKYILPIFFHRMHSTNNILHYKNLCCQPLILFNVQLHLIYFTLAFKNSKISKLILSPLNINFIIKKKKKYMMMRGMNINYTDSCYINDSFCRSTPLFISSYTSVTSPACVM